MRPLALPRAAWRLACALVHGLHGLVLVLLRFPSLDRAGREARIAWWSARMFRMLGMGLEVRGAFRPGAKMIVANHVSWLDILAVHAACPQARFVSKAEVRHWPLVARLVDSARTLYLERGRARDALRVVHQCAEALQAGDTVAVFPEGTVNDGHALLSFHGNLLQAAISTASPVQPVALRYADAHGPVSRATLFTGDITLRRSLWWLACADGVQVRVTVLPAQVSAHADRRRLAEHLREEIARALAADLAPQGAAAMASGAVEPAVESTGTGGAAGAGGTGGAASVAGTHGR
ncbi:MAG: lysophospholipid acyltransferase family protein [Pseudomonadota bacterium]